MEELLLKQRKLMKALQIDVDESHFGDSRFHNAATGLILEAAEVLETLNDPSKPWKQITEAEAVSQFKNELIDVLFYFLELAVLQSMSWKDIQDTYSAKYRKNLQRIIDSEYSSPWQIHEAKKLILENFVQDIEAEVENSKKPTGDHDEV